MNANICINSRGALRDNCEFGLACSLLTCPKCQDRIRMICTGEWYIREYFMKEVTMRLDLSYLSVPKQFTERLALF